MTVVGFDGAPEMPSKPSYRNGGTSKMNTKWLTGFSVVSVILLLFISLASAGQVVTEDVKAWANKALKEEKSIEARAERNTLAVLYFQNRTGQSALEPLQKGLTFMLITDLSTVKNLEVVERVKLQALVEEMGLGTSGLADSATAPRVGRLLRAQWLISGDIQSGQPNQVQLQSYLLDVQAQQISGQPQAGGNLSDLFTLEKELLFGIIKLLKLELTPDEDARLRKPCSRNTNALLDLFRGIDASDHDDYEKAAAYYQKALKEDPNICGAKEAIRELESAIPVASKNRRLGILNSVRSQTSVTNQLTPKEGFRSERKPDTVSGCCPPPPPPSPPPQP